MKTLLYILFFYYAFKVLSRLFAPFLMRYAAKKMHEKFKNPTGQNFSNQETSKKPEGEVYIKSNKKTTRKSTSDSVGDYVDFEEVEN